MTMAAHPALRLLFTAAAGILAGVHFPLDLVWWLAVCGVAGGAMLAGLLYEIRRKRGPFPLPFTIVCYIIFIACSFAASTCFRLGFAPRSSLIAFAGRTIILFGRIADRPEQSGKGIGFLLEVEEVFVEGRSCRLHDRAKVYIRNFAGSPPDIHYGEMVMVKGTLGILPSAANRGEFSPRDAARMKQYSVELYAVGPWHLQKSGGMRLDPLERYVVQPVYGYLMDSLMQLMPDGNERSLAAGVLTGEKAFLPEEVFESFRITGTAHILAVSGLNVGLLALALHAALQRLKVTTPGRWFSFFLLLFILLVYCQVTGNSASVKRASIMSAVFSAGETMGRKTYPINSLALSDFFILLFDPLDLLNPGFLMTNAAVISILLLSPVFSSHHRREGGIFRKAGHFLIESFLVTASAIIGVAPVIAFFFGTFSLAGLLANIPVVFFSTLLMYALVPMLLVNLFSSHAASFFAESALFLAAMTLDSAGLFSSIPFASTSLKPHLAEIVLYYITLASVIYYLYCRAWGKLSVSMLLGANLIFWHSFLRPDPVPRMLVTVNLGRNIATLFAAGGETLQIDAGSAARDNKRIRRQIEEYGFSSPSAAVQFFSPDSLVSLVHAKHHMLSADSVLVLPSMVIARPGEKALRIFSRKYSLLLVSGTSRLKREEAFRAGIVFLWVYRFDRKQREQLETWLAYACPDRCILIPGSFLSREHFRALQQFAAVHPDTEVRTKTRQIVIPSL